jgi:hypothetical protein
MSTVLASNLAGPSGTGSAAIIASLNGGPLAGTRNRIINGDMRIDQRNNGSSVTVNSSATRFPVDRFKAAGTGTGVFTAQRSTVAPTGFTNSLLCTVTTAQASLSGSVEYYVIQAIEGLNVSDFSFGTSSAATVTLSFWVRSSLTGSFGFALKNSGATRTYPTSYTISAANTWEYKTISIPGSTLGTWLATEGTGFELLWSLGAASGLKGTANTYSNSNLSSATGTVNWISTNGATFHITGVQLEAGSIATPFERRHYGHEVDLCLRYFESTRVRALTTVGTLWYNFRQIRRATPVLSASFDSGGSGGTFFAEAGAFTQSAGHSLETNATVTSDAEL